MNHIFEPGSTDDLIVQLLYRDRETMAAEMDDYRRAAEKREKALQRLRAQIAALSSQQRSTTGE